MLSLGNRYLDEIEALAERIRHTQGESIARAADVITESIANGGAVHLMDTGHMLMHELFGRVGGLMMFRPVNITMEVTNPGPKRLGRSKHSVYLDEIPGLPQFVLDRSEIYTGDVLIIGSVSGKNTLPVGLALEARKQGVHVIALTSVAYSSSLAGEHPSGKRLFEAADIVLDNCGVVGDAALSVENIDVKVCPTSGIAAAIIMWTLEAEIIQRMLARGLKPHAWLSNHLPGADAFNKQALADTERLGY
ncbi:MAG: sugar isomerase domain-containing protein [Clostridia bacterium]|nr:sugar isomerase domain-containing protein [Clostridia bacterium]